MILKLIRSKLTNGDNRSVNVKINIAASFMLKGVSILTSFMLVPATIGYVSSELYGVWLALSSILTWVQFFDIGLTQGLKNKLTEAIALDNWTKARNLVSTTYFGVTIIFLPFSILCFYVVPFVDWCSLLNVNPAYSMEIERTMQILVFFVGLQMIVNVIVSIVAAFQRVALSQAFLVIGNIVAFAIVVVLTHTVPPSLTILSVTLAGSPILVTAIASLILFSGSYKAIRPSLRYVKIKMVSELFSLGIKFFVINIQVVVVFQTANLLISHVSSPESVTAYNIAYKYLNIAMILYTNITLPLWPAYTDAYTKGDYEWMRNMRRKMNRVLLFCSIGCIVLATISQPVYKLWIGNRAIVPDVMTWLVAAYVIVYCIMNLNGTFIVGMGKVYLDSIVVGIGMMVYVPMALTLAHYFKEYGIIIALILLNICYAIVFHIQATKLLTGKATGIWNK